jgi:APA family basic amino acid/polyamine antiporter
MSHATAWAARSRQCWADWAIYGAGAETVMQGILLLLAGIPVYVWLRKREN